MMSKVLYWLVPKIVMILALIYGLFDACYISYSRGIDSFILVISLIIILLIYDQIYQVIYIINDDERLYSSRTVRIINCTFMSVISTCYFVMPFVDDTFPLKILFSFTLGLYSLLLVSHDIVILIKARQLRQTDISDFGE